MAAVDRGAPRSIASLEGIVRMVGAICWNNDRVEQTVVLFIPSIMSSHLASFSCRPKAEDMRFTDCRSESTWFVSPPIVPSSKYQMLTSEDMVVTSDWMAKLNKAGPKGSPCCTPVAESRV